MSDLLQINKNRNINININISIIEYFLPKIEIKTYQLNNYILCENIYFWITILFLMLSQSNNFINSFFLIYWIIYK